MTDYQNRFGTSAANSTSGSLDVEFTNMLDFGKIDERAAMQTHRTGEAPEETIVFSGDGSKVAEILLWDSDEAAPLEDFDNILSTKQFDATITAGDFAFIPFPKSHKRFVRVQVGLKANTKAGAVSARIEPGVALPRS